MKKKLEILVRPWSFFNRNGHFVLLVLYLCIGGIDYYIRYQSTVYRLGYWWFQVNFSLPWNYSLWVIEAIQFLLIIFASHVFAFGVVKVRQIFGHATHQQQLQRRLEFMFLVALLGQTLQLAHQRVPMGGMGSLILFGWVLMLFFLTIRALFQLDYVRTSLLFLPAIFIFITTYRVTGEATLLVFSSVHKLKLHSLGYRETTSSGRR